MNGNDLQAQEIVRALRARCATSYSEQALLESIQEELPLLRKAYQAGTQFSDEDVEFLKLVKNAEPHLKRFVEIQEEIDMVNSQAECAELASELRALKQALAPFKVSDRVSKEQRELRAKQPFVLDRDRERQTARNQQAIDELERSCPLCPKGHKMVIRSSPAGNDFWGCSEFPSCRATKQLDEAELAFLRGTGTS